MAHPGGIAVTEFPLWSGGERQVLALVDDADS